MLEIIKVSRGYKRRTEKCYESNLTIQISVRKNKIERF